MWCMLLGSYGVMEVVTLQSGGQFGSLLDVQTVVNHVLPTVMCDCAVIQLVLA